MPKQTLAELTSDVTRLLIAGSAECAADEGLKHRAQRLRELGKQVAALNPIADAVDKVIAAPPKQAAAALLDLSVVSKQVKASLVSHGLPGTLEAIHGRAWTTDTPVRDLYSIQEKLSERYHDTGRMAALKDPSNSKAFADLRLIDPMLQALGNDYAPLADLVAREAIPRLGTSILPELESTLDCNGKAVDARKLLAICSIDRERGKQICLKALEGGSEKVRVQALECLGTVAPEIVEGIAMQCLADPKSEIRAAACVALKHVSTAEALDAMLKLVNDTRDVWTAAQECLSHSTHPLATARIVSDLKQAIADYAAVKEPIKKKASAAGTTKAASKPAKSPADKERERLKERILRLLSALSLRSDRAEGVEFLLQLAQHELADIRCQVLGQFSDDFVVKSTQVIPTLIEALADSNGSVVRQAIAKIREIGLSDPQAVSALIALANHDKAKEDLRSLAIAALGNSKRPSSDIVRTVLDWVHDSKSSIKWQALQALREMGPALKSVLPQVIETFEVDEFRAYLGGLVARIDPEGTTAIPLLIAIANDSKRTRTLRKNALAALGAQVPTKLTGYLQELLPLLEDKHLDVCVATAELFFQLGEIGLPALPGIHRLIKKGAIDHPDVTIKQIEPEGTTTIPVLIDCLSDSDKNVRINALHILKIFGTVAGNAKASVEALSKDRSKEVRELAALVLQRIQ